MIREMLYHARNLDVEASKLESQARRLRAEAEQVRVNVGLQSRITIQQEVQEIVHVQA